MLTDLGILLALSVNAGYSDIDTLASDSIASRSRQRSYLPRNRMQLQREKEDGQTLPLARRPSSRITSRWASRRAMSWRLSCACLPRANASSTFTLPSEKYSDNGTRVRLPSRILPTSMSIWRRCNSSLRLRRGAWLVHVPW